MGPDRGILALVDRVVQAVALYCGGVLLAGLMAMIITDVTCRYLFNAPLFGSLDLAVVLLVLIVACAIGYGGRTGAHVTADMVTYRGWSQVRMDFGPLHQDAGRRHHGDL